MCVCAKGNGNEELACNTSWETKAVLTKNEIPALLFEHDVTHPKTDKMDARGGVITREKRASLPNTPPQTLMRQGFKHARTREKTGIMSFVSFTTISHTRSSTYLPRVVFPNSLLSSPSPPLLPSLSDCLGKREKRRERSLRDLATSSILPLPSARFASLCPHPHDAYRE